MTKGKFDLLIGGQLGSEGKRLAHLHIETINLNQLMDEGCDVFMETPQGFDLSINSGLEYPYCTSREITVEQALADAQVHYSYLDEVSVVIRTFPIRVGNIIRDGETVGYSGPFAGDSDELTWPDIGVTDEITTNTNRKRRVATFSFDRYNHMIERLRPQQVFLNFANYLSKSDLDILLERLPEVTHICDGPMIDNVKPLCVIGMRG